MALVCVDTEDAGRIPEGSILDNGRGVLERPSVDALGLVVVVAHATVASEYKLYLDVSKYYITLFIDI